MQGLQLVGDPEHVILSTSTELLPLVCHDVNGYYRALGVPSNATRRQLAAAYRAAGGPDDAYLTYIFKFLLNAENRRAYDAAPPGAPFRDWLVLDAWRRQAERIALRDNALYGTSKTAADILKSLGLDLDNPANEFLASAAPGGFDGDRARDRQPALHSPTWPYAYLTLDSACTDVFRLAQWQGGLGRALADCGIRRFAVGFHGTSGLPFLVAKDIGVPVLFLHEDVEVTGELIAAAATAASQ